MKVIKNSKKAVAATAAILALLSTKSFAQDSNPTRADEIRLRVECDPMNGRVGVEGAQNGEEESYRRSVGPSAIVGLSPLDIVEPSCKMAGSEKGGHFLCSCADGTSKGGALSSEELLKLHADTGKEAFAWCQMELARACGPFPKVIERECESPLGSCLTYALGRNANQGYTDIVQDCGCEQGGEWYSLARASEGFELTQEQLDKACQAQLTHCEGSKAPRFGENALEIPDGVVQRESMVACMNVTGACQVESVAGQFEEVLCECEADDSGASRWFGKTVATDSSSTASRSDRCLRFLSRCQDNAEPKNPEPKEPQPKDPEPGKEGSDEPKAKESQPQQPDMPEPKAQNPEAQAPAEQADADPNAEPDGKASPAKAGCSMSASGGYGPLGAAFVSLTLFALRRRSSLTKH